ncbi:MAG: PcfJ domain-containing protein [Lachnospiraceae bacterium]|nr:PcfJ domain-containing protein [Lachnospiraceae bacterium]
MLDINILDKNDSWEPEVLSETEIEKIVGAHGADAEEYRDQLLVFRVEPYIDVLYVHYAPGDMGQWVAVYRRFAIHPGYVWSREDEYCFEVWCLDNRACYYNYEQFDEVYRVYAEAHPEWHLQRYFTKAVRLLDHIYHCTVRNTSKEMLYKAGLDELAAAVSGMDEVDLLSTSPQELYEGLTMRTLRAMNCKDGALLVQEHGRRAFVKILQEKYPRIFEVPMNDAQCRYLQRLIDGDLTVQEAGRLYLARRKDLYHIWNLSQYELFLLKEKNWEDLDKIAAIDPMYEKLVAKAKGDKGRYGKELSQLRYYLLEHREEYDKVIRRANRQRPADWQERNRDYIVRYPQTINDFCREAIYMSNCLFAYIEALTHNDTTILFMRRTEDANTPYITLEIFGGSLRQAYHRFNEDCTPKEAEWIRAYCARHNIVSEQFYFDRNADLAF